MASVINPVSSAGSPPPGGDPGERLVDAIAAQIDRMEVVLKQQPAPVLTDKQVEEISKRLARGCGAWAADMVRTANRHHYVVILGTIFAAAAAGALASWLVFGKPIHPICALTPAGGKICGEWTIPEPKQD